jgi:hypothetical protein
LYIDICLGISISSYSIPYAYAVAPYRLKSPLFWDPSFNRLQHQFVTPPQPREEMDRPRRSRKISECMEQRERKCCCSDGLPILRLLRLYNADLE